MTVHSKPLTPQQDSFDDDDSSGYELDDHPLSKEQVRKIQELADQQAFTGVTICKKSLLPDEL